MRWTIFYHESARDEADAQPQDIRSRLLHLVDLIEEHGLDKLPQKAARHLRGDLWGKDW